MRDYAGTVTSTAESSVMIIMNWMEMDVQDIVWWRTGGHARTTNGSELGDGW